jgi:integrase
VRFLTDAERPRLLTACQASSNRHLYPLVILALSTGARKGELVTLTWPQVDLGRALVTLHETKNGEPRSIPLTGPAVDVIRAHAKVVRLTPLVFPRQDGRRPVDIRYAWYQALRQAGIDQFRFHDLRHSAASYLAMNGASLVEIADVLGHKTLAMVQRYAHLSEGHTRGVLDRMTSAMFR